MLCKCGQEAGGLQFVSFEYAGLKFSHMVKDSNACLECLKKETVEFFETHGRELVSIKDDKIKVNWVLYKSHVFEDESAERRRNKYTLILKWLGILSRQQSGNWCFEPNINISIGYLEKFYFTRRRDAIEYGRSVCGEKSCNWMIKLTIEAEVISKREVIKGEV